MGINLGTLKLMSAKVQKQIRFFIVWVIGKVYYGEGSPFCVDDFLPKDSKDEPIVLKRNTILIALLLSKKPSSKDSRNTAAGDRESWAKSRIQGLIKLFFNIRPEVIFTYVQEEDLLKTTEDLLEIA